MAHFHLDHEKMPRDKKNVVKDSKFDLGSIEYSHSMFTFGFDVVLKGTMLFDKVGVLGIEIETTTNSLETSTNPITISSMPSLSKTCIKLSSI